MAAQGKLPWPKRERNLKTVLASNLKQATKGAVRTPGYRVRTTKYD